MGGKKSIGGWWAVLLVLASCQSKSLHQPLITRDASLESFVSEVLIRQMDSVDASGGAVALMEVSTGNIVAWVERTGAHGVARSDSNLLSQPMEPGTLMFPVSMMLLLEKGLQPSDTVDTFSGMYSIAGRKVMDRNYQKGGFGRLTASQVVALSSNVGMIRLADRVFGEQAGVFRKALQALEWNNSTACAQENALFAPVESNRLSDLWFALGDGVQIRPIALMGFYNAIANNGCMVRSRTIDSTGIPEVLQKNICSSASLSQLQGMLRVTVQQGTGKMVDLSTVQVAGKTGEVQRMVEYNQRQHLV